MVSSKSKKRYSTEKKNLRKIYRFKEEDMDDAKIAVEHISQLAITSAFENSPQVPKPPSSEQNSHYQYSNSHLSHGRAFRGSNRGSFEKNKMSSTFIKSNDTSDVVLTSPDSPGTRRRKTKESKYVPFSGYSTKSSQTALWMCGVSGKTFASYEAACSHEDFLIRKVISDLGWPQTGLELRSSFSAVETKSKAFQATPDKDTSHDQPQYCMQDRTRNFASNDQKSNDLSLGTFCEESKTVSDSVFIPTTSRPDLLTVSSSTRVPSARTDSQYSNVSSQRTYRSNNRTAGSPRFTNVQEYDELSKDHDDLVRNKTNEFVVLADEALADVCWKSLRLALTELEEEAEFELECYSKDKRHYDILEEREIERQRDGAYSRFRTEGKNFAEKIQNKFVDAYAVMKEGKSESNTASVDHYKRKVEGNTDVQNALDNTKHTLYVNVIVKNSIQVVSHELDRLARQRWEESKKNTGASDVRNKESRAQFEKFKAVAQGSLVQLAGLALASDFTPRRIAVQLSNDLYRLLTPRLKRRGVFIESEIEYRIGPYFVLAVNIRRVDWERLVRMTHKDVLDRRAKWIKIAESDSTKEGVARRSGPLPILMGLFRMTSMEVLAGILAALYHTHWVIYTPICWFLYRFLIGKIFRKYFLSSVTDEIFYYVEQKGMEMNIQIQDAETQAACMLSALQEIRADSRALKKKQEKASSAEGQADLLGPMLGPAIKSDGQPAPPIPRGFGVPDNLEFVSLELNLQVGFRRLRWALLSSESSFIRDAVWKVELNYDNIEIGEWNKFNDKIGAPNLPDAINQDDFIGAEKETSYLMPKSAFVAANIAHETAFIESYNDYCFSLKLRALTPDVPYGTTFEAWTKYVVINTGRNNCKLTCSVEAIFPNGPPMISRQIKSGMRDGVGKVFVTFVKTLERYADAYP